MCKLNLSTIRSRSVLCKCIQVENDKVMLFVRYMTTTITVLIMVKASGHPNGHPKSNKMNTLAGFYASRHIENPRLLLSIGKNIMRRQK